MTSTKLRVNGSAIALGDEKVVQFILYKTTGDITVHLNDTDESLNLGVDRLAIKAALGKAIDLSKVLVSGNGEATLWKELDASTDPVVNTDSYNPEDDFTQALNEAFTDTLLTDVATWKTTELKAVILDEELHHENFQGLTKTAEFKIADLPRDWKVGDSVVIGSKTYYANHVLEQDQYTVKVVLNDYSR